VAQFVSLWAADPVRSPSTLPAEARSSVPRKARKEARQIVPSPDVAATAGANRAPAAAGNDAIDWQAEATAAAKAQAEPERALAFGKALPVFRKPCKPRENPWFEEPKALVIPPGSVAIGKHCFTLGQSIQCVARVGQSETDTERLVAALQEDEVSSIPHPEMCDE